MDEFSLINRLIDRDEFSYIVPLIDKNAVFPFALTCKASYKEVLKLKEPIKTTYASVAASVPLIEWAIDMGCPSKERIWGRAAGKGGKLDVLKWICENTTDGSVNYSVDDVALGGHLHVLEWAYEKKHKNFSSIYKYAAEGGHINVLEWAKKHQIWVGYGYHGDFADVTYAAAKSGHYDVLNWLRQNGFEWDSWTCAGAAYSGKLEVLQWLRTEGCEWDGAVYWQAAEGGHFDIVKWAHENGLPIEDDRELCGYAAKGGHFEMLKWARANGFPWGRYAMWWAALYNHLDILKWVHANGCVCNFTRAHSLSASGSLGPSVSFELINWVAQNLGR